MTELIINMENDPHFNLALEECLLTKGTGEYLLFWRNGPSVIIGRHQNALKEVNFEFARANGIRVVRRMSGGGAVFHDLGNINFSVIAPCARSDFFDFERFARPVLRTLESLGVHGELSGRNDITVDGRKISGNAQLLHHGRILHHGTLLFSSDFEYMQGVLTVDPRKLAGKGVASVRSRVANIGELLERPMDALAFLEYLNAYALAHTPGLTARGPSEAELRVVERLIAEKYARDEWNIGHVGDYNLHRSARFPFGEVAVDLLVERGSIRRAQITGDFFGRGEVRELEAALTGLPHTPDALLEALRARDVGAYIEGMDADAFVSLVF